MALSVCWSNEWKRCIDDLTTGCLRRDRCVLLLPNISSEPEDVSLPFDPSKRSVDLVFVVSASIEGPHGWNGKTWKNTAQGPHGAWKPTSHAMAISVFTGSRPKTSSPNLVRRPKPPCRILGCPGPPMPHGKEEQISKNWASGESQISTPAVVQRNSGRNQYEEFDNPRTRIKQKLF